MAEVKQNQLQWFDALQRLLVRDRELHPQGVEFGRGPSNQHAYRIWKLSRLFSAYGCREYWEWLTPEISTRFKLKDEVISALRDTGVPRVVWSKLKSKRDIDFSRTELVIELNNVLSLDERNQFQDLILNHAAYTKKPSSAPERDIETAALQAIIEWLKPVPGYSHDLPAKEREGLVYQHHSLHRLAQDRLKTLNQQGHAHCLQWEGDDWDALQPRGKVLLLYMVEREMADLKDLCLKVWGKEYLGDNGVTENARETLTCKVNKFLSKREHPKRIKKVKGEPFLRWE